VGPGEKGIIENGRPKFKTLTKNFPGSKNHQIFTEAISHYQEYNAITNTQKYAKTCPQ
jgi:hypothetical protein